MANISELTRLQIKAILGPDSQEQFLIFISDLLSNSKEKKAEAKSMLEIMKQMDPESLAIKLSNCLASPNSDIYIRAECAEHLCDLLTDEDLFIWHNHLSVSTQSAIKCILLDRIKLEQDSDFIIKRLCYTILRLATSILPDNNWPELLPFLFQCLALSTSTNYLKVCVFMIFASLAIHIGETLIPCVKPLHPLFLTTLNDHTLHLNVRFHATIAVLNFISYVPTSSNGFQELLPQLQKTHMEAILGPDSQDPFEAFICDLDSSSEEILSEAKSMFKLIKDKDPQSLAIKLSNGLSHYLGSNPHPLYFRARCAEILCELLTDVEDKDLFTWHTRLSVSTQTAIKRILLDSIKLEQESNSIIQQLCSTVCRLAISLLPDTNNWPELLPFLFQCLSDSTSKDSLKSWVFWIFGRLAKQIGVTMVPCVKPLHSLFLTTLNDYTLHLCFRVRVTEALIYFILDVPTSSHEKQQFQKLLPCMMRTLTDVLSNCDTAKAVLYHFIRLAKEDPKFFRLHLRDVVYSMLEIGEDKKLETETRHLALEFVMTLVEAREKAPGMMKKLPLFTHTCFAVLLNLLLDIKDEPSWHSADEDFDGAGTTDNHNFGQLWLHRFSIALGGKTVYPVAMEQLGDYLAAPEWEKRHAALDALSHIAEGSSKVMIKYLQRLVDRVLPFFHHPHPRVKWAAIRAIGQLSVAFCPVFQERYHNRVLPALAEAMDDSKNPRMQVSAALAVYSFCGSIKPETLLPHLDKILNKLLVLLQNDYQMVQEGAVKALSKIAFLCKEHFHKYYDIVVPYLKTILINANDKSNRNLLREALECISMVALAVGKEIFRDDFKQVMEVLKLLQESTMRDLDTIMYILSAYSRMCECMGKDFLPYISTVMPTLFECAQLEPLTTVPFYEVSGSMHKVKIGNEIICVKESDLLTAKSRACCGLGAFAFTLKEHFYPWISQAASILVPLLKFYIHDEVRKMTTIAMHTLLHSAKLAVERGAAQSGNMTYFNQLCGDIIMALGDALYSEPKTKICALILEELNSCLEICGPLLDEDQISSIIDEIKHVLNESSHRKQEFAERAKSEDFDDEEDELMREEKEQEIEVFKNVGDIISTLIKIFKASFLPFFDKLSFYLMPVKGEDKAAEERKKCILIFDEILSHCGESAIKYYEIYIPFLLDSSIDENPDVRVVALLGLGLCAACGGYSFKPFIRDSLSRINEIITHCNALEVENIKAYETAVWSLACHFQGESIDSALILPAWLNCLPIRGFLADVVHNLLCSMIESSDEVFWGHNDLHLPKVISVFTKVLCAGDSLATKETRKRMINILRHFTQALPLSTWASIWPLLLPEEAMELESVLSAWKMFTFQRLTIYCDAQSSTLMILQP